jgi:CrcB protein
MSKILFIQLLYVGFGGFFGAVARHLVNTFFVHQFAEVKFPLGIFTANVLGCFLIGLLAGLIEHKEIFDHNFRLMLITGLLGAFTTFSTFSKDTYDLFISGYILTAFLNIFISVILGLIAVAFGIFLSSKF